MKRTNLAGLAALLGLLACSAPAAAQAILAAQAGNLRVAVTDLTPADGAAAAIDFTGAPVADIYTTVRTNLPGRFAGDDGTFTGAGAIALDPWAGTHLAAGFLGNGIVVAADTLPPPGVRMDSHVYGALAPWNFRLAPHTRVSFSLDMDIDLASGPASIVDGEAQIVVDATFHGADGDVPLSDGLIGMIGAIGMHHVVFDDHETRAALLEWDNTSDAWIDGELTYSARVEGYAGSITPVPEPAGWSMLAAGAALLGMGARRRQHGSKR